jgi:hypothetical protein
MLEDRRSSQSATDIPAELIQQGKVQLQTEIQLLEQWLQQLDETRKDNAESQVARKTYMDMLQSRQDLLSSLQKYR